MENWLSEVVGGRYQGAVDEDGKMFYVFLEEGRLTRIFPET